LRETEQQATTLLHFDNRFRFLSTMQRSEQGGCRAFARPVARATVLAIAAAGWCGCARLFYIM